ncbi:hypothetical protein [Streptomyces sp. NPDC059003]|uniref:hypothetical protein n=1 Tax=Streptomyces sp. NPDC059003 TaxID=3346691 RepID=UPI0036855E18
MPTATERAEWMALQILITAKENASVITSDLLDAVMNRNADNEGGQATKQTVRRLIRKHATAARIRVILTDEERYWAIREQLHHMTTDEVHALRDSIADGGDSDPRAWDRILTDAISVRLSNQMPARRLDGVEPVSIRLWSEPPLPPGAEKPAPNAPDTDLTTLYAPGEQVRVTPRSWDTWTRTYVPQPEFVGTVVNYARNGNYTIREPEHGTSKHYDARHELHKLDTPAALTPHTHEAARTSAIEQPAAHAMRTVNGGTPERIELTQACHEVRQAIAQEGRTGVRALSNADEEVTIIYSDVRGVVKLRAAPVVSDDSTEPDAVGVMPQHAQDPVVAAALAILRTTGLTVAAIPSRTMHYRERHSPQGPQGAFIWPGAGRTLEVCWFIDGAQDEKGIRSREAKSVRVARNTALDTIGSAFRMSDWSVWRVESSSTATRRALRVDVTPPVGEHPADS